MTAFIDDHRAVHGVSAICKVLQVVPSSYYARLAIRADLPGRKHQMAVCGLGQRPTRNRGITIQKGGK
jgi:hypothetical protein